MNVVLVSRWYPVAISRYFESALKRRDDINLCVVGPYTGNKIPWKGGMVVPEKYAVAPDIIMDDRGHGQGATVQEVEHLLPWKPDVWIQVDGGFSFVNKPAHGYNIFIATDPHVINYFKQRGLADIFYCMQTPYMAHGDLYLPYAFDPIWHGYNPDSDNGIEQEYDVTLIGLQYPERMHIINELRSLGANCFFDTGQCYDEARMIYHRSKIGLNWASKLDLTARVFELLGMGRLAVVNRVPDLSRFFVDGTDLIAFTSHHEAVEKIMYYLKNKEEATEIAMNGWRKVQDHTWDARVEQILNMENYNA